jgi:hypothetical protein
MVCAGIAPVRSADTAPPSPGADLYAKMCASCHDHPKDRIPPRDQIAKRTPEEIVAALSRGTMRVQAGGLNLNEQNAIATFLTGRVPSDTVTTRGSSRSPASPPRICRN